MKEKKETVYKVCGYAAAAVFISIIVYFLIQYWPELIAVLKSEDRAEAMREFVASLGVFGACAIVLLQAIQIAVAFLPGEPVELASGMLYGGFFGSLLCLAGAFIGTTVIYYGVKRIGRKALNRFKEKDVHRFHFFEDAKRAETLTAILFLIPVVPKDFLAFVAPFTPMKPIRFLVISVLARTPGMLITTYAGKSILAGDLTIAILLYGILGIGALIGCFYYKKLTDDEKRGEKQQNKG